MIRQAVILAGGQGTRLRPLTYKIPKPMAPVNGRPFLAYLVDLFRANGIKEIILLLGYLPEKVMSYFGDGSNFGVKIRYSIGAVEDETGTRLRNAHALLDDQFFLMYGDNYWPLNLEQMEKFYAKQRLPALMTVYTNREGFGEYGYENNVHVADNGVVMLYDRSRRSPNLNGTEIGSFILTKDIIEITPLHNFSFEQEIIPKLIANRMLAGYCIDHHYHSITDFKKLKIMEHFLAPKKVVFLDRDGVINKKMPEGDYVKRWSEFQFLPGVIEALRALTEKGYQIFIVTNQRGIARGLMKKEDVEAIHARMTGELAQQGVALSGIYYCPHSNEEKCHCRKPQAWMLFRAAYEHHLDLTKAYCIGDSQADSEAGERAGCRTFLVDEKNSLHNIVIQFL